MQEGEAEQKQVHQLQPTKKFEQKPNREIN